MRISFKNFRTYNLQMYTGCNHKCKMCLAYDRIINPRRRSLADIKEKLCYLKKSGYSNINFAGAEPTLYPHIFEAIRFVQGLRLGCTISTNASKFSSIDFTRRFLSLGPVAFKIPFHSHKPDVFDYITGVKGSYQRVVEGIGNINHYFKISELDYSRIAIKKGLFTPVSLRKIFKKNSLQVDIPINRLNYRSLPEMVDFLYARKIKVVKFFPLTLMGRLYSHPELTVDLALVRPYLLKAVRQAGKHGMLFFLDRMPVCLLESQVDHFIPPVEASGYIKLSSCVDCRHYGICHGLSKLSIITRYRRQLIGAYKLFPENFYRKFFNSKDAAFIKKL